LTDLRTERLILRQWRDSDREPFAALNGDAETMRYFPAPLTCEESDALVDRASAHIEENGWGLWAVEVAGGAPFVGFVGLARPRFAPELVEVGWRLHRDHWGQRLRDRGGTRIAPLRLRGARPRRDRLLHDGREQAVKEGHGSDPHDARSVP
jgi:hypothetical protein